MQATFTRDRFTWLAYLMLTHYAYLQATLGPAMPFLRAELQLSYTVAGLHFSAFALGMMLAGLTTNGLVKRFGRGRLFWGASFGMSMAALVFVALPSPLSTIPSAFCMGLLGSYTLVVTQSSFYDHFKDLRAYALTESNMVASLGMMLGPLLVGQLQAAGLGWRSALLLGGVYWLILWLALRGQALPTPMPAPTHAPQTGKLSRLFWLYCAVIFLAVCAEWSFLAWAADFMVNKHGWSKVAGANAMSAFLLFFLLGRLIGSRWVRRTPPQRLVLVMIGLVLAGFLPFWLAPNPWVSLVGLLLAGIGAANLFPMSMATASAIVPTSASDKASGRIALVTGSAVLVSPQVLGALADPLGIAQAYGLTLFLLAGAAGMALFANTQAARQAPSPLPHPPLPEGAL